MRQNIVEWGVLAVSAVAIATLIVVLTVDSIGDEGRPPEPTVTLDEQGGRPTDAGWLLPATVGNAGDQAAEQVVVEAVAEVGGARETSQLEVEFLPAGARIGVAFGFSSKPGGDIEVRVVGYRLP